MIHVCGGRFVDRAPNERSITVVTNCPAVTLVLNGAEVETKAAVDHCVVFENAALTPGSNTVTAKAGDVLGNTIVLNGVEVHNTGYDLPEEGEAGNWFEDPAATANRPKMQYPAGFYSMKDPVGVLMADPVTAQVLQKAVEKLGNPRAIQVIQCCAGLVEDPMQRFYSMMRLADLLKMGGKGIPFEFKYALNEQLTQIRKPV